MPLASTWRGSRPAPGGQAPVAVPAVTSSKLKHARQREAALGKDRGRPLLLLVLLVLVLLVLLVVVVVLLVLRGIRHQLHHVGRATPAKVGVVLLPRVVLLHVLIV